MSHTNKELEKILAKLVMDGQYDWCPPNYTGEEYVKQATQAINSHFISLLEGLKEKMPEEEDYLTAPGSTEKEIKVWNKYRNQALSAIDELIEGMKK